MSSADAVIAALRTGHDRLAAQVSTFSDDDLAKPSGAAEWDVSQVLSHLGSGAEIFLTVVQASLGGEPNPGNDFNHSVWDRWNAMTRRQRADGFLHHSRAMTELFEAMDQDTRENARIDLGFLPAPIGVAATARMRLNELILHSWDVRVAFDPQATLPADAVPQLLPGGLADMLHWISKPERLDGAKAVIKVTTSDPASVFALRLDTPVALDDDVPGEPDGTLTLPAESWLRLVSGRLSPEHTPSGVTTTGAADLGLLRRVFPGY